MNAFLKQFLMLVKAAFIGSKIGKTNIKYDCIKSKIMFFYFNVLLNRIYCYDAKLNVQHHYYNL